MPGCRPPTSAPLGIATRKKKQSETSVRRLNPPHPPSERMRVTGPRPPRPPKRGIPTNDPILIAVSPRYVCAGVCVCLCVLCVPSVTINRLRL